MIEYLNTDLTEETALQRIQAFADWWIQSTITAHEPIPTEIRVPWRYWRAANFPVGAEVTIEVELEGADRVPYGGSDTAWITLIPSQTKKMDNT